MFSCEIIEFVPTEPFLPSTRASQCPRMVFGLQVEHVGGNGRHLGGELLTSSAPGTNANPFPPFPDHDVWWPENSFTLTRSARRRQKKKKQKEKSLWKSGSASGPTFPQALLLRLLNESFFLSLLPTYKAPEAQRKNRIALVIWVSWWLELSRFRFQASVQCRPTRRLVRRC